MRPLKMILVVAPLALVAACGDTGPTGSPDVLQPKTTPTITPPPPPTQREFRLAPADVKVVGVCVPCHGERLLGQYTNGTFAPSLREELPSYDTTKFKALMESGLTDGGDTVDEMVPTVCPTVLASERTAIYDYIKSYNKRRLF